MEMNKSDNKEQTRLRAMVSGKSVEERDEVYIKRKGKEEV